MSDGMIGLSVVGGMVAMIAGIIGLASWGQSSSCANIAAKMAVQHSWAFNQGCMVLADGKWIPLKSYRVIGLAR